MFKQSYRIIPMQNFPGDSYKTEYLKGHLFHPHQLTGVELRAIAAHYLKQGDRVADK